MIIPSFLLELLVIVSLVLCLLAPVILITLLFIDNKKGDIW